MKKLQMVTLCLALIVMFGTGCPKTNLENQTASDSTPTATPPPTASDSSGAMPGADSDASSVKDNALGASGSADSNIDINRTVYFEFDSARLDGENQATLSQKAQWLQNNSQVRSILIEGHCDERGTDAYNMALGARRADAVKDYLVDLGVPNSVLATQSYGEEKPADPSHNEAAWAKNRRASFVVD